MSALEDMHRAHKERLQRLSNDPIASNKQIWEAIQAQSDRIDKIGNPKAALKRIWEGIGDLEDRLEFLENEVRDALLMAPDDSEIRHYPSMQEVRRAVCDFYDISDVDLTAERRTPSVVTPRHVAMYLCRTMTKRSTPIIGKYMGKDHSTVCHAYKKIARLLSTDAELRDEVQCIMGMVAR